jgi:phosphoribosylformimino-5-aminoimidazole carboxamide ribotide isomerase
MKIIPAIDLINGQCVRLTKGDYNTKKTYHKNPLDVAKIFEDAGITHLHLVDLDGAKANRIINHETLALIAAKTNLIIDFGGGLKSEEDLKIAFESGAQQVTIGSVAAKDRALFLKWLDVYGSEKIILGADCINHKIAIQGWIETSDLGVKEFIEDYYQNGIKNVICTDISKDGMLKGPSLALYKKLIHIFPNINLIASGGVAGLSDLKSLAQIGCSAAIIGKALYENKISLKELEKFNLNQS